MRKHNRRAFLDHTIPRGTMPVLTELVGVEAEVEVGVVALDVEF
jgi:hypothetical protein